jgi:dihydroxy-acid dehydratase
VTTKKKDAGIPDYAMVERVQLMRGVGLGQDSIRPVQVGVASSWGEINPASINLDKVTEAVKAGVWAAGGTPREFVISALCTSMAGHDNYHLPHRDLVAGYIEAVAMTNLFDAMVFVTVCDDVVPAHLMAAARLDIPAVVVTGGYMSLNRYGREPVDPLDVAGTHYGRLKAGTLSEHDFCEIQDRGCPGMGACPVMGTANTMAAMTEALGMSLPGNTATPGADSRLMRIAFGAGRQVVNLHQADIKPSDIMTRAAFENAIRVLMATGGSTNGVLHLQAIAAELGLDIDPETFNRISGATPLICDVAPNGDKLMVDFDEAGGLPSVMKELQPLLDTESITVTGRSLAEDLERARPGDRRVIRSLNEPLDPEGGLVFLHGNLAPEGALIKKSAVPPSMLQHTGPARIFDTEEDACDALLEDRLEPGDVVVVRSTGPKGDPGMRLLQRFLWQLAAKGLHDRIAFLSDGRFSGTNKGCAVGHIAPEAAVGGPIALLEDGDTVEIDVPNRSLNMLVPDEEIEARRVSWSAPELKPEKGYLSVYRRLAASSTRGAAIDYEVSTEEGSRNT